PALFAGTAARMRSFVTTSAAPRPMPRMRKAMSIPVTVCSGVNATMPMPKALSSRAAGTTMRGAKRATIGTTRYPATIEVTSPGESEDELGQLSAEGEEPCEAHDAEQVRGHRRGEHRIGEEPDVEHRGRQRQLTQHEARSRSERHGQGHPEQHVRAR